MNDESGTPSSLRASLQLIFSGLWLIVLCALVAGCGAYWLSSREAKVYRAAATLQINDPSSSAVFNQSPTIEGGDVNRFLQTQVQIILSRKVAAIAAAKVKPATTADAVGAGVSAGPVGNSNLVSISASDTDADMARQKANAFSDAYIEQLRQQSLDDLTAAGQQLQAKINEMQAEVSRLDDAIAAEKAGVNPDPATLRDLQAQRDQAESVITLYRSRLDQLEVDTYLQQRSATPVSPAELPTAPISPRPLRQGAFGGILGLLAGLGLVVLFDRLDDTLRTSARAKNALQTSELGVVPRVDSWRKGRPGLASAEDPGSAAAETFRIFRTNLRFSALPRAARLIAVTSSGPAAGKTTVVTNLAWALAEGGAKVIVVDGDLRKPALHERFGLENREGLTDAILGEHMLLDLIRVPKVAGAPPTLRVLTSGQQPPNPSELLGLERTHDLFQTLTAYADFVLLDSAPILPVSDGLILARIADATILVVDAERTTIRQGFTAIERLRSIGATVIGFVLNRARPSAASGYGRYGTYAFRPTVGGSEPPLGRGRRGRPAENVAAAPERAGAGAAVTAEDR